MLELIGSGLQIDWTLRVDVMALSAAILIAAFRFHRDWVEAVNRLNVLYYEYCKEHNLPFQPLAGGKLQHIPEDHERP